MQSTIFIVRTALALVVCSSAWALADEHTTSDFGVPIPVSALDSYRGGFDMVNNNMQLSGAVTNNSAVHVMTGSNYIADGSFANASGFPMVIQNSGANVLIQNATIINVQYE